MAGVLAAKLKKMTKDVSAKLLRWQRRARSGGTVQENQPANCTVQRSALRGVASTSTPQSEFDLHENDLDPSPKCRLKKESLPRKQDGEQASLLHQYESGIPTDEDGIKKAGLKPKNATAMQHTPNCMQYPNPPYQSSTSSASSPYYQLSSIEHSPSTQSQSPRPAASYDSHNAQRQLAVAAVLSNHGPSTSSVRLPAVASLNSSPEPLLDDFSKPSQSQWSQPPDCRLPPESQWSQPPDCCLPPESQWSQPPDCRLPPESQWSQPPDCRLPLCTRPGSMDNPPPYSEFDTHGDHSCAPYQDKCDKGANCVSSLHEKSENTTSAVECTEDMGLISPGKLSKVCEESRSQCDRNDVMITGVRDLYDSCVHTRAYENVPYSEGSTSTCTTCTFPVFLKSPDKPSNSCEEPHGQNDAKVLLVTGMKPLCDSYVYTYMYGYGSRSFSTHLEKGEKSACPIIALSEDETSQQRDRSSTDKKCTPKNDFMGIAVHEEVEKHLISSHRFLKENSSELDDKSEFTKSLDSRDSTIARNKTTSIKGPDTTCGVVCTTDTVQLSLAGIIGGCPRLCSFPIETLFTYNRNIAIAVVMASRCILSGVLQALIESGSMNSIVYPLAKVSLAIQSMQVQNVCHRYLPVSQSLSMQRCEKSTCNSTVSVDSSPKQRLKVICYVRKIYKFLKTCQTEVTTKCVFEANCDISNHKRQKCAIEKVLPWRYMYKQAGHSKNKLECDGLHPPVHQQLCDFSDHNAFKNTFYPASTQVHHRMQDVTQHNKRFRPVQTVMCFEHIIHHRKIIQSVLYSCSFSTHCILTCLLKNNVTKLHVYDCSVLFHQPYQCSFTIAQDIPFLLPPTSVDKAVLGLQIDNYFRNNQTISVLNCLVTSALLSRIELDYHDTRVVSQSINIKLLSYNVCAGIQSPNQSSTSIGTAMTCMLTISSYIIACKDIDYVVCSSIWLNFATVIHQAAVFLAQRAFLYIKSVSRGIQTRVKGFHAHVQCGELPQTLKVFLRMQFTIVNFDAKLLSEPLHLWVSPVSEVLHTFNTQSLLLPDLNDALPSSELSPCQEKSACYVVTKALSVVIPFASTELFKQVRIARCIICSLNCVAALDTHVLTVKKTTRKHSRITCSSKRDHTNGLRPNITTDLSPLLLSYHELHASAMYFQSLVKYNVVESIRIVGLPKTTFSILFASATSASINLCPRALHLNELSEYVTVIFSKMQLKFFTQVTLIPETGFRGPQEKMYIMAPTKRKGKSTINSNTLNTISWPVQYTTDSGPLTSSCPVVLFTQLIGFEWVRFHIWKYLSIPPHSGGDQVTSVSYLYMLAHGQLAMTIRLKILCWTLTSAELPKRMDHNSLYGHECMLSLLHPHDSDRDDIKVITRSHLWAPSPSCLKFESTGIFSANKRGTFRSDTIKTKQRPTSLNSEKMAVTFFMNPSPRLLPKTPPLDLKQPTRVLSSPQSQGDAGSQSSGGSSGAQGNNGKGNKSSDNRNPVGGGSGQGSAGNGERDHDDGDDHRKRKFEGAKTESQDEDGSEEKQAEDEEFGSNAWQKIGEQPDKANLSHCSAISSTTLLSPSLRKVDIHRAKFNSDLISVLPEFNKGNGEHSKRPTDWRLEKCPSPGRLLLHSVHGKQNKSTEQEYQTHFSQPPDPVCGKNTPADPYCGKNTPPDPGCRKNTPPDPGCGKNTPPDPGCGQRVVPDPGCGKNTLPDPGCGQRVVPDPGCGKNTPPDPGCGKNTPPDPGCGKNTPPDPGCGKNTPPDPGCGKNTPPNPSYGKNTPLDPGCGKNTPPDPGCGKNTPPDPGCGQRVVPDPGCGKNTLPDPGCGQRVVPDPGCGKNTPPDPGCGKNTPPDPGCGKNTPPDPGCGKNTPPDPGCGKNTPPNPSYGKNTPLDPGCGKNTPPDPGCGKNTPPDPGCGKNTPPDPGCGKNTPPYPGCGQRAVPDSGCGKNTPPDPGCGKNTPPDPDCGKNTPPDPSYGKNTPLDPDCEKNTPRDPDCEKNTLLDPGCGKNTHPDPGCGKNTLPDPGCGMNTPPDPGCGKNTPPNPSYGKNTPIDPDCEKNTPLDPDCGKNTPPDPGCGKNTPPDPGCGKNTPPNPGCGKNTPPDPGCGQRVVPDPGCGKNTPPDPGCGQRVVPDPGCGKNTPPDPSYGKNTPLDPDCEKNTPLDPDREKNTPPDPSCGKNTPPDPGYGKNTPPDPGCGQRVVPDPSYGKNTPADLGYGKNTPPDPGCGKNTPPDLGCGQRVVPDPCCGRNTPPDQLHVIKVPHTNPSEQTHESAIIPPIQKYDANNSETKLNQRFKSGEVPQDRQALKTGEGLDDPLNNRYRSNVHLRTPLDKRSEINPPEEEHIPISKSSTHEEQPPDQISWSDAWQGKSRLTSQSETQAPQMEPPTEQPSTEDQVVKTVSHCFQSPASDGKLSNHNSWCSSQLKGRQKSESALCAKSSSSSSTQQSCLVYMKSVFILLSSIKQNSSFVYLSVLSPDHWLYWNTSEEHGSGGVVRLRHHDNYKYFRCNKSESICSSDDYDFSLPVQQHGLTSSWNWKKFETYNDCNHNRYSELVTGMPSIPYIPQIHTNVLVYHFGSIHACNEASSSSSDDTNDYDANQSPEQASEIETESSHELESDEEDQKEKEVLEVRNEPGSTHESEDKCHGWEEAEENIKNGYSQEHLQRSRDGSCVAGHDFKEAVQCKDAGETNVDFVTHTKSIVQKAVCVLTPSDVVSCSPGPPVLLGPGYTTFPIHAVPNCLQPETSNSSDIIPVEESQFAPRLYQELLECGIRPVRLCQGGFPLEVYLEKCAREGHITFMAEVLLRIVYCFRICNVWNAPFILHCDEITVNVETCEIMVNAARCIELPMQCAVPVIDRVHTFVGRLRLMLQRLLLIIVHRQNLGRARDSSDDCHMFKVLTVNLLESLIDVLNNVSDSCDLAYKLISVLCRYK